MSTRSLEANVKLLGNGRHDVRHYSRDTSQTRAACDHHGHHSGSSHFVLWLDTWGLWWQFYRKVSPPPPHFIKRERRLKERWSKFPSLTGGRTSLWTHQSPGWLTQSKPSPWKRYAAKATPMGRDISEEGLLVVEPSCPPSERSGSQYTAGSNQPGDLVPSN